MDFSVSLFANRLFDYLVNSSKFPYMKDEALDRSKHSKRNPLHLQQAIKERKIITGTDTSMMFDIGNETLELSHPYYHILQQAPVIRKKYKGTKKTKGSQDLIKNREARDYEQVSFGGKFGGKLFKEYSKNVRGERNRNEKVSHWKANVFENKDANSYVNIHYKYIDKILDEDVVDRLALEFGLKKRRKEDSGLTEELAMQWGTDEATIVDIMNSFN